MSLHTTSEEPLQLADAATRSIARVNLLPPEVRERRAFRKVQVGLGAAIVAILAVVGLLFTSASGSVNDAQSELDTATTEQVRLQSQAAEYAGVTAVYVQAEAAQAMLFQAMNQEVRYSGFLNDLSLSIPDNVWVTNISFTQAGAAAAPGTAPVPGAPLSLGTATLTGVAFEHDDVAAWLDSLATQVGYATPYLQSSTDVLLGKKAVVDWTSSVVLTPEALSLRYTETGG